jgi:hypothetical protein
MESKSHFVVNRGIDRLILVDRGLRATDFPSGGSMTETSAMNRSGTQGEADRSRRAQIHSSQKSRRMQRKGLEKANCEQLHDEIEVS